MEVIETAGKLSVNSNVVAIEYLEAKAD